jgi:hypothetical protein
MLTELENDDSNNHVTFEHYYDAAKRGWVKTNWRRNRFLRLNVLQKRLK